MKTRATTGSSTSARREARSRAVRRRLVERGLATPSGAERRATGLGWFCLGIGLVQLIAPSGVGGWIGADDSKRTRAILGGLGARHVAQGLWNLVGQISARGAWLRVAGDAAELAFVGLVTAVAHRDRRPRAIRATSVVACVTALDVVTAFELTRHPPRPAAMGVAVREAITVNRRPTDVYDFFRRLENLPRFVSHIDSVDPDGNASVWRAKAPFGSTVQWRAEIVEDVPGERIAWRSLPGSTVHSHGSVRVRPAPGDRGTELLVSLKYDLPGRSVARRIARLLGYDPRLEVRSDLRRLKQTLELSEVLQSDATMNESARAARPSKTAEPPSRRGRFPRSEERTEVRRRRGESPKREPP